MKISRTLGAYEWDPQKFYLVKRSPWLDSIKRGLRHRGMTWGDRLFLYVSRDTVKFVLGFWIKERPGGVARAFLVISTMKTVPQYSDDAPTCDFLVSRLMPAREAAKAGMYALREEEYQERMDRERQEDAKREWMKWVKKKDPELHRGVDLGIIPVEFGQEQVMADMMNRSNITGKVSIIKPR